MITCMQMIFSWGRGGVGGDMKLEGWEVRGYDCISLQCLTKGARSDLIDIVPCSWVCYFSVWILFLHSVGSQTSY